MEETPSSVGPVPESGPHSMPEPQEEKHQPVHSSFGEVRSSGVFEAKKDSQTASSPMSFGAQKSNTSLTELANAQPMAVVKVFSVRGVEYAMMSLSLWVTASSLLWLIVAAISGTTTFDVLVYPTSFLVVGLPVFAFFFLRLRKAELAKPELRFDPSKRRWSQVTQILAFIVCLANAIAYVYQVLSKLGGNSDASIGKATLNMAFVLAIAGGVLLYYWFDEHREFSKA